MEELDASEHLSYQEYPVEILEMSRELPGRKGSKCARCNEVTTPRKKLHGREKNS
jgi:hypothetical protein